MFAITLSGAPVSLNELYATMERAEHVAHVRYSDLPPRAPACPHIPRRTWQAKGYRIEPANLPHWQTGEDHEISLGHECRAEWGTLGPIEHHPRLCPTYAQLCKVAYRARVEDTQYPWTWFDAVDHDYRDRHDSEDNQEEPMAYGHYEEAA